MYTVNFMTVYTIIHICEIRGQLHDKIGTSIHTHNTGVLNIHQIGIGYNAYTVVPKFLELVCIYLILGCSYPYSRCK